MRIVYGVHGYGRGHATRAMAVLPELAARHELLILAGGDAHAALWPDYHAVVRIPTLGYFYGRFARPSPWLTLKRNLPAVLDLWLRGPGYRMVSETIRDFRPDVIISDAESWTHRVGKELGIPRISFDHFGVMAHCLVQLSGMDHLLGVRDQWVYRRMINSPERVIVSSFYDVAPRSPNVKVVGPLLRREVLSVRSRRGDYLLAYFNRGEHQFRGRIENSLAGLSIPVIVYGTGRRGTQGNLTFRPPSGLPFIEDLAGCRAVISTAGNQLVGEALHFGKPLLVMPEDCVEQRLNAAAVRRMGIGATVSQSRIVRNHIESFLEQEWKYRAEISRHARDGRSEALAAIEEFAAELVKEQTFVPAEAPEAVASRRWS